MTLSDYYKLLSMSILGYADEEAPENREKMAFVNDFQETQIDKITEFRTWYAGDSDALLNFYNYEGKVEYLTEPWYFKNKRSYFWVQSSKENDIKRTHSGFARDAIDTITAICVGGKRAVRVGTAVNGLAERKIGDYRAEDLLLNYVKKSNFWSIIQKRQFPLTLVDGWGAIKISWDKGRLGNTPLMSFYGGHGCRIYKLEEKVMGMLFIDYIKDARARNLMVCELRRLERDGTWTFVVDVYESVGNSSDMRKVDPDDKDLPIKPSVRKGMPLPYAAPISFYEDPLHISCGKSVLEGRIDILDDLDQCLSQAANTIRRSTPIEVFDSTYMEKDVMTLAPKFPKSFERKYVKIQGVQSIDGGGGTNKPVEVTQPQINSGEYESQAEYLKMSFLDGFMAPATMGINLSKTESQGSQREKEKQTIFTKNALLNEEVPFVESILNQILCAIEFLNTGANTVMDWGVSVGFDELANTAFESKIQFLANALANNAISPEMFVEKMYGDTIPEEIRKREVEWISRKAEDAMGGRARKMPEEDEDVAGDDMDFLSDMTPPVMG